MAEVVQSVLDTHRDEAAFRGVSLSTVVEANEVGHWDPQMVDQMVSNLVSNAIRYGVGSPVEVRAGRHAPGVAFFRVTDAGPGIPESERMRMFQKFERVVASSGHRSGFGLGLWIVARLAAAHQGSVEVQTPAGGGCAFTIKLPLQPAPTQSPGGPFE